MTRSIPLFRGNERVLTFDLGSSGFKQIPRSHPLSYQRLSVVGTNGSGKTTFAGKTSNIIHAPHIELDALHWEPNWVEAPNDLFQERVKQPFQGATGGVDANYHQARDIALIRPATAARLAL